VRWPAPVPHPPYRDFYRSGMNLERDTMHPHDILDSNAHPRLDWVRPHPAYVRTCPRWRGPVHPPPPLPRPGTMPWLLASPHPHVPIGQGRTISKFECRAWSHRKRAHQRPTRSRRGRGWKARPPHCRERAGRTTRCACMRVFKLRGIWRGQGAWQRRHQHERRGLAS
jgi:hypothetical protein